MSRQLGCDMSDSEATRVRPVLLQRMAVKEHSLRVLESGFVLTRVLSVFDLSICLTSFLALSLSLVSSSFEGLDSLRTSLSNFWLLHIAKVLFSRLLLQNSRTWQVRRHFV